MASNSLDEYTITSLLLQDGPIDIFGVGERLITSKSDPVFGAVYKIASVEKDGKWEPRIKISEAVEKITNPGLKKVYRVYNEKGRAIADLLTLLREVPDTAEPYRYINPEQPWRELYFENCTFKEMKQLIIKDGKLLVELPTLDELRQYVKDQLETEIWPEEQRFEKGSELLITRGNQVIKEVVVESYRTHKNNLLVKFVGIDTIEEAEKLKNLQIKIDSENIGELEENEFYFHEIIGCEVFDENGKSLGEIIEILTPGANDVWVIKGQNGKEILIPYIEDVVKKIDIENKKIDIEVMEGLID